MLLANKEAVMTVLDTLNFVAFNPLQNNNPIAVRRRKLIAKIDEQIQLAANKDYTPTQHKWVTDEHGNQRKVEVAKRVKRWWTASVDGKINLIVRYGSKPLEFAKGKNAIELASEAEVADVLAKVREAAEHGELDALINKRSLADEWHKRTNDKLNGERVWFKHVLRLTMCNKGLRKLLNCNSCTSVEITCKVVFDLHITYTLTMMK